MITAPKNLSVKTWTEFEANWTECELDELDSPVQTLSLSL